MSRYQTPDANLLQMIARIQAAGSKITDFNTGSVTRTFYEGLGAGLSEQSLVVDQLEQDSYLATATGDALDRKASDYQVDRLAAVAATGTVRLTRQASGTAVTVPAGFGELATVPVPGQPSRTFLTTADAVFGTADTSIVVPGIAVTAGAAGNIGALTKLLPVNPVAGFQTDGGFQAETTFTGGVDQETDDALRARVPIAVQGRVKGRPEAFLAAALGIPGVISAAVLKAGDTRSDSTVVPANTLEVYYEGPATLLQAVTTAAAGATVLGQSTLTVAQATAERTVVNVTVFAKTGVDAAALAIAVRDAIKAVVNGAGIGQTVYSANVIQAVAAVPGVVSQTIPYADLRKFTAAGGTFGNVVPGSTRYPDLQDADVTVAVSLL